jgi:hypothetical protein
MADRVIEVFGLDDNCDGGEAMLEVADPSSPFAGLFAWGRTVSEASEGLARTVWADVLERASVEELRRYAEVRVVAVTAAVTATTLPATELGR